MNRAWALLKPTISSNNIYSSGVARSPRLYRYPQKRMGKRYFSARTLNFASQNQDFQLRRPIRHYRSPKTYGKTVYFSSDPQFCSVKSRLPAWTLNIASRNTLFSCRPCFLSLFGCLFLAVPAHRGSCFHSSLSLVRRSFRGLSIYLFTACVLQRSSATSDSALRAAALCSTWMHCCISSVF